MPALLEKVSRLSSSRKAKSLSKNKSLGHQTLWYKRRPITLDFKSFFLGSGNQDTDMPESARSRQEKQSCEPEDVNRQPPAGSSKSTKVEVRSHIKQELQADRRTTTSPATKNSCCDGGHSTTAHTSSVSQVEGRLKVPCSPALTALQSQATSSVTRGTPKLDSQVREELSQRKEELIDRLMAYFEACLDQKLEPLEEPCDGEGCSPRPSRPVAGGSRGGGTKRQSTGPNKKTPKRDRDGNGSDDEDRNDKNMNNKRPKATHDGETPKMYACPFYKYRPERFNSSQTCRGHSWPEISRLKEHLKRHHALPDFACERCLKTFKTKQEHNTHVRSAQMCELVEPVPARDLADGYNRDQKEQLEKKSPRNKPGHEKWVDLYCILFEEDHSNPSIPSPYYNEPDSSDWRKGHTDTSLYAEYLDGFRRMAKAQARAIVRAEVDKYLNGCEDTLKTKIMNKVPMMVNTFHHAISHISPPEVGYGCGGESASTPIFNLPAASFVHQVFEGEDDRLVGNERGATPDFRVPPTDLVLNTFEGQEFQIQPSADFNIDNMAIPVVIEDSSNTSGLSDSYNASSPSANTSINDADYLAPCHYLPAGDLILPQQQPDWDSSGGYWVPE